jgi:AcrR family transcriptional regulator
MSQPRLSRRDRYRADTIAEIKELALSQIAAGGIEALSLNAIAKDMAVSGGAIYRYFASREDLLADLAVDAYESLASTLETAAAGNYRSARERARAVTDAFRQWALDQPHRYRLAFFTPIGSGQLAPDRVVPAAQRSMNVFLHTLAPDGTAPAPTLPLPPGLDAQLQAWHQRSGAPPLPSASLHRGLIAWTRLHGLLSLELEGHLAATQIDPALLYRAETDALITHLP